MKLLITGDWHLRLQKPRLRKDESYLQTQIDKATQILSIADKNNCNFILQPGDFFDGHDTPFTVLTKFTRLFLKSGKIILTIQGQHDQRHHTRQIDSTPLGVIDASNTIHLLKSNKPFVGKGIDFYSAGWREEIPEIKHSDKFNVLLTHRMVIKSDKLWNSQKSYDIARGLLKHNDFDLIVSGDNHSTFTEKGNDKLLVNCGSLLRTRIDQEKHKPCVYVFDTETKDLEQIYLDIVPANKIFDLDVKEREKSRNEKLESFINGLDEADIESMDLNFSEILYSFIEKAGCDSSIKTLADEFLQKYHSRGRNVLSGGIAD